MKPLNYLQALYRSFYSKALYRDVAKNWRGSAFLYLLFVLAISWAIILSTSIQPNINKELKQALARFAPQFPDIMIEKGIVTTPEKKAYYIKNPDTKEVIGIIDTTDRTRWNNSINLFLLTKTKLYWSDQPDELSIRQIPKNFTLQIKPLVIKNQLEAWASWLWIILFPFFVLFSFVFRIIQTLLYAIIGKLLALFMGVPLRYGKIFFLGLVSITPAILIGTILDCFVIRFSGEWLVYVGLALGYLFFAIWANKDVKK
jgi:hypothetical protein